MQNNSSMLSCILRYRCTNIPHRQTHTRTQCMLYSWYFSHERTDRLHRTQSN